ncbi:MAG: PDZ domain-containing protein [Ruminococcus sp.]|nr:PDZ domain-containing protein [Ruminococcus sp.]
MKKAKAKVTFFSIILMIFSSFTVNTAAAESNRVILGGTPFGIKMFSQGVMVIDTETVNNGSTIINPAEKAGIKPNDIILSAMGKNIKTNEQLSEIIENSQGNSIELAIKRNDKNIKVIVKPVKNSEGIYKAGMWVKDSAAGIGTVTFYSDELNGFCGLGHGICESSTGMLIPLDYGTVDKAYIADVTKSYDGKVGSLNGYFTNEEIGTATLNINEGIYGITDYNIGQSIEIAEADEIKTGKASIYTTINGNAPEYYDAEIVKINRNSAKPDMIIKITDEELISVTGGIVQGMSGSPIVQNGKLVGAITHVIIDDVDCGYGIFAQRMMEELETKLK